MKLIPDQKHWKLWDLYLQGDNGELSPDTLGHQICPTWHCDEMLLDFYLICCVKSGMCIFYETSLKDSSNSKGIVVRPGYSFLITPNKIVSYKVCSDEPWINAWIAFSGTKAKSLLNETEFGCNHVIETGTFIYDEIKNVTDTILQINNNTTRYMYAASSLWKVFAHMNAIHNAQSLPSYYSTYTERAISLIHRYYNTDISVSDIANSMFISREYLYTLFKNDTGKSPSQYLMNLRIEKSCALLSNSNYTVQQIAQYLGFYDHAYFSKVFKNHMKISPKEYRLQMKLKTSESNNC